MREGEGMHIAWNLIDRYNDRSHYFHVTLTTADQSEGLERRIADLSVRFKTLTRRQLWKRCVVGGVVTLDVAYEGGMER